MGAVDVGVGHDDQFVVAQFCCVKGTLVSDIVANTGAEGANHGLNFLILEHLCHVVHLPFHVQNLPAQRKDGLRATVSPGLGRATCGIALNQIYFALLGLSGLAVRKFTRQTTAFEHAFSTRQIPGFSCGFTCFGGQHGLVNDEFANRRIFLEVLVELLVDHRLDDTGHLAAHEFVLGLRGKRRVGA